MAKIVGEMEKKLKNLTSLQKNDPSIVDILGKSQHCALYQFMHDKCQWERSGVEGVAFVVEATEEPHLRIVFLNRLDVNDFTMDLTGINKIKLEPPYLMLRITESGGGAKIVGLWFHDDADRSAMKDAIETGIRTRGAAQSKPAAPIAITAAKSARPATDKKPSSSTSSQLLSLISSPRREGADPPHKAASGSSSNTRSDTPHDDAEDFMSRLSQSTKDFHASTHTDGRPITPQTGPAAAPLKASVHKTKVLAAALFGGSAASLPSSGDLLTDRAITDTKASKGDETMSLLAPSDLTGIRKKFPKQVR